MSGQLRSVRVFVASPSDVSDERKLVREILEEINTSLGDRRRFRFEYVGWEDVNPGMGPPQKVVSDQISPQDCDLFIGIMWGRFGTPTESFGSGTEEEFQQAYESWRQKKSPRIFFYFCDKTLPNPTLEQWEQYGSVLKFKQSLNDAGLIWSYSDSAKFANAVRRHLMRALDDLIPSPPPEAPNPLTTVDLSPPRRFTVFVASVRDVLGPSRAGLLEQLGLTDVEISRPDSDPEVTRALMARAHVCVHLLDGTSHPVVDRQLDLSCAHARRQLLWLSPRIELSSEDPDPYRRLLFELQSREGDFDFMRGRNAVPEILERIKSLREEWLRRNGRGIYFNTHGNDKSLAQEVFDYLMDQKVEPLMNEDDLGEPSKALQEFDDKASRSRAIVVFFGAVNAAWVTSRMTEIIRLLCTRGYPVEKLGIYAAPPPSKSKKEPIRLPWGIAPVWMDNTEGFNPRTLDDLL